MLTVITGQPHPDLEAALRSSLCEWRSHADFSPAFVVLPSNEMRRHVKLRIARDWGESFVGLRLVTAQGLARMILDGDRPGDRSREAADTSLLEELVRGLVRSDDFPRLGGLAETAGGPAALLATLRDLTEACFDPGAIKSSEKNEILRLYAAFSRRRREAGLVMHTDLTREAASAAGRSIERSAAFARLNGLYYYGFCDMTAAQAELLSSVARASRVTFFLPLSEGPAYEFPRAFFREVLEPIAETVEPAPRAGGVRPLMEPALCALFEPTAGEASGLEAKPRVISVSGTEAELEAAAREVLRLVEDGDGESLAWSEVAVIARSLAPYLPYVESVFGERRIPFRSSAGLPAGAFPAAKAAAALVRVFADGMRRTDVIDLVGSPWFARRRFGVGEGRQSRWDLLSRQLRIVGGETQWAKLKPIAEERLTTVRRRDEEETRVDPGAARDLWSCVSPLIDHCATFPEHGTWEELASAFERAFERFLDFSPEGTGICPDARLDHLTEDLREAVRGMHEFGVVSKRTGRAEFLAALTRRLEEISVPLGDDGAEAVEVLDAMAARCRSFRAVVVVGLDGQKFPSNVEQDPFLPDELRASLSGKYGVRLAEKAGRFDEERLLFHLTVASAGERLTLTHQRSDDEGKPLVPSWYLGELQRAAGGREAFEETRVPRLFADQLRVAAAAGYEGAGALRYLTPREWREGLVIEGARERKLWDIVSADGRGLERTLAASDELATPAGELGPRDGITGPLPRFFDEMRTRGFSPTGLQRYAACPFSFFAAKVLGLKEAEKMQTAFEPGPGDMGTLIHGVLETCLRGLLDAGYFAGGRTGAAVDPDALLRSAAEDVFGRPAPSITTGSPLVWERVRDDLRKLARTYVARALAEFEAEGWVPVGFEVNDSACVSDSEAFPENVRSLKFYGFIDRLDRREIEGRVEARVVDYKFKSGGSRGPLDNNLARGAVRGQRLQPPVYLLMARDILKEASDVRAEFHFIAPNWTDGPVVVSEFPSDCWSTELGLQFAGTVSRIVGGISRGEWFAVPGAQCEYCEFSAICRKSHGPTRYRLAADGRAASLAQLAREEPVGGSGAKRPPKEAQKKTAKKRMAKKGTAKKGTAKRKRKPGKKPAKNRREKGRG